MGENVIELYRYENIKVLDEIKESKTVTIEEMFTVDVKTNGNYILMTDKHPDADKIIEIFNGLDGSN